MLCCLQLDLMIVSLLGAGCCKVWLAVCSWYIDVSACFEKLQKEMLVSFARHRTPSGTKAAFSLPLAAFYVNNSALCCSEQFCSQAPWNLWLGRLLDRRRMGNPVTTTRAMVWVQLASSSSVLYNEVGPDDNSCVCACAREREKRERERLLPSVGPLKCTIGRCQGC